MYLKVFKTELGFGEINDDHTLALVSEFDHDDCVLEKKFTIQTYLNPETHEKLYEYKGNLYTFKELNLEYLKEYYSVE